LVFSAAIATLACLFAISGVLLVLVMLRHARRRRDEATEQPVGDEPPPVE
jgi:hypothetical protein